MPFILEGNRKPDELLRFYKSAKNKIVSVTFFNSKHKTALQSFDIKLVDVVCYIWTGCSSHLFYANRKSQKPNEHCIANYLVRAFNN